VERKSALGDAVPLVELGMSSSVAKFERAVARVHRGECLLAMFRSIVDASREAVS